MLKELGSAFKAYWEAWKIIVDKKLWWYLIIPGAISLFYGLTVGMTAWYWHDDIQKIVSGVLPANTDSRIFQKIQTWFIGISLATSSVVLYKYVINVLLSPILSALSRRVEESVAGYHISYKKETDETVLKDFSRAILFGFRNFIKEAGFTVLFLLIGLIPALGFVATLLIFLIQALYVGYCNHDFTLSRYFSIKGSIDFNRTNKILALGNGIAFMLIVMIPVVGLFFAPTLATAAATLSSVPRVYRPTYA